jgi:hypothetical protein
MAIAPPASGPVFALWFRRYAPFASFGVPPFKGDNRGPSTDPSASSRTFGCVGFTPQQVLDSRQGSSGTEFDLPLLRRLHARSGVSLTTARTRLQGPMLIEFEAHCAGSNPLMPGSPDIDTFVTARVDSGMARLLRMQLTVRGDNFPNLEVFVQCLRSGHTALLIDGRTTGGRHTGPLTRLWGAKAAQELARATVSLPLDAQGALARSSGCSASTLPG